VQLWRRNRVQRVLNPGQETAHCLIGEYDVCVV
jgi:hypothetical protein